MTVAIRSNRPARYTEAECRIDEFIDIVGQRTDLAAFPGAVAVEANVLIYDGPTVRGVIATEAGRATVEAELARALTEGPGVVVLRGAFTDPQVVDRASAAFEEIIAAERQSGRGHNDHFAQAGANDRIWNAFEKLAVRNPDVFVDYYGNDLLALISTAWLGPGYQITSQVNVVRPGGRAQSPHRDYHLGFLPNDLAARYPAHAHHLSPVLTLQGAVAHCDMPVSSGPTMYLPYSHQYAPGYLAWRLAPFRAEFDQRYVQLPLAKGDAVFFNPALFHGAGTNVSADVQRMANLLQVSSAFGRAMESVDRAKIGAAIYPALQARKESGVTPAILANVIAAAVEGYPFPTNLDLDPNVGGLMPQSQADLLTDALDQHWTDAQVHTAFDTYNRRHRTDEI
jgi:ectoine hydroxylase-related dioxygenase (phytanoyl-CoA dioxygenase family)